MHAQYIFEYYNAQNKLEGVDSEKANRWRQNSS